MTEDQRSLDEAHANNFMITFAKAVLAWGGVEQELFVVFHNIIGARTAHIASAVYHSVINFNARMTMIDQAAMIALAGHPLLAEWEAISKSARKKSKKRNALAHLMVKGMPDKNSGYKVVLGTNDLDVTQTDRIAHDAIQIEAFKTGFLELTVTLDAYVLKLIKHFEKPLPDKSLAQAAH